MGEVGIVFWLLFMQFLSAFFKLQYLLHSFRVPCRLRIQVANPLFIICAVMMISTAAAGQYMLSEFCIIL